MVGDCVFFVGDWSATVRGLVGDCLNPQSGADVKEKRWKSRRRSIALASMADADIIPPLADGTMVGKKCLVEKMMTTKTMPQTVSDTRSPDPSLKTVRTNQETLHNTLRAI